MSIARLSSSRVAAVDIDRLAGDETRRRRSEKHQHADDVLDLAEPADGGAIEHLLIKLRLRADEFAVKIGDDDSRADGVDRDAVRAEFERQGGAEIRRARPWSRNKPCGSPCRGRKGSSPY